MGRGISVFKQPWVAAEPCELGASKRSHEPLGGFLLTKRRDGADIPKKGSHLPCLGWA